MNKVATITIIFSEDETNTGYNVDFEFHVSARHVHMNTILAGFRKSLKDFEQRLATPPKPN